MKTYEANGRLTWYDRRQNMWVLQTVDADGCQVGEAEHSPTKRIAMEWLDRKIGGGDCYEAAVRELMSWDDTKRAGALLCHGTVTGQGAIRGVRYGHAWIEVSGCGGTGLMDDGVVDTSNGRRLEVPAYFYYVMGEISNVTKYSFQEAVLQMVEHRTYGPWTSGS